uniref:G protein-coupled receptor 55 n=1 Tax=Oryzias sinensis TaxID=183150 RepID=A0A8C7ZMS8_9TELE
MNTNCSFDEVDNTMKYVELIIYIPIFLFGMVLNVFALVVFCVRLKKWTESTIYMTNLALMDLILLLQLPFKMHATNYSWPTELLQFCTILENLYFVGIYGSIYTVMCIAGDRWIAICHPFKAKQLRSPKAALIMCIGVWVVVFSAIFPIIYSFQGDTETGNRRCFHRFSKNRWNPSVISCLQVFGFLGPALVIIYCSVRTICALHQSGKNSSQCRACVKIIYSSLSAFLVPFTPSHLAIFLQFLVHQGEIKDCSSMTKINLFIQVTLCLSNITCCLDALCYYFAAQEARSARQSIKISLTRERKHTFSTSEV